MIVSYTGPMFSDKSAALIEKYNSIWNKNIVVAVKPRIDTRDGASIISKKYPDEKIPAMLVDTIEDIKKIILEGCYKTVLIDEAEFLTGDVSELVDLSVLLDINFYISGLNMTSEQEPFGIMPDILAVSDEIIHIHGSCQDCGGKSSYTYSLDESKVNQIKVGNDYISLCPNCLKKRYLKNKYKVLELKEQNL